MFVIVSLWFVSSNLNNLFFFQKQTKTTTKITHTHTQLQHSQKVIGQALGRTDYLQHKCSPTLFEVEKLFIRKWQSTQNNSAFSWKFAGGRCGDGSEKSNLHTRINQDCSIYCMFTLSEPLLVHLTVFVLLQPRYVSEGGWNGLNDIPNEKMVALVMILRDTVRITGSYQRP